MSSSQSVPQLSKAHQATTANTKPNRLPAPTLFVGPPSRNASQLSMHNAPPISSPSAPNNDNKDNRNIRGKSALTREYTNEALQPPPPPNISSSKDGPNSAATRLKKPSERSLDTRWREMQNTLNEVELTAQNTTHVFGASHAAALDELRKAQIELARAWGRGSEEQRGASAGESEFATVSKYRTADDLASERASRASQNRNRADTNTSASTTLSDESELTGSVATANSAAGKLGAGPGNEGKKGSKKTANSVRSQLEEETAQDIRLASERREANEAYFNKVDAGVKEVVAKLEVVAEAMRGVEEESRSLWSATTESSRDREAVEAAGAG